MVNSRTTILEIEEDISNAYNAAFIGKEFIADALISAQQTGVMSRHVSDACAYALWQMLSTADEVRERFIEASDDLERRRTS
jgi:hypothetical protein